MFMRYRGGGVGHKTIREATHCLLDDRDALNKKELTLKHDHDLFDEGVEGSDDDIPMDDSSESEEESSDESKGEESEVNAAESECLIDDELGDEMEEYGYSGLDQVLEDKEDAKVSGDEDALGPEDGEDPDNGLEYAEL